MKILKILLILGFCIGLLIALTVFFILSSSGLQTAIVKRTLPEEISLNKAHLGFKGLTVEGVKADFEGTRVDLERMRVDFSLMRTLARQHLHVREFSMTGILVDLTDFTPDPEPREKEPSEPVEFGGIFPEAEWGSFSLDTLNIEARAILPGGLQTVDLVIAGKDFHPDKEPLLKVTIAFADETIDAVLPAARVESELRLAFRDQSHINQLILTVLAEASIQQGDQLVPLRALTAASFSENEDRTGEEYAFGVTFFPETEQAFDLFTLNALFTYAEESLTGNWSLNADTRRVADLTADLLQGAWAEVQGEGAFQLVPAKGQAALKGAIRLEAQELDQFMVELETLPSLLLESTFDLEADAKKAEIRALEVTLAAPRDRPLIEILARQSFGFNLETQEPFFGDPATPLLELSLHALPIDTVNALVPDLEISLGHFGGRMTLAGDTDTLQLATIEPLSLGNLSLVMDGESILENITVALAPRATYTPTTIEFDLGDLMITQGETVLTSLRANGQLQDWSAEDGTVEATAEWLVVLEEWLAQPVAEPFREILQKGSLSGDLQATGPINSPRVSINPILEITGLQWSDEETPVVQNLSISARPQFQVTPEEAEWTLGDIVIATEGQPIIQLSGEGTARDFAGDLSFDSLTRWTVDLPKLLEQPVGEPMRNLEKGDLSGELKASGTLEAITASLQLLLADLTDATTGESLESISFNAELKMADEKVEMTAPLLISGQGLETDFLIDLVAAFSGEQSDIRFKGDSKKIVLNHFTVLAGAMQNPHYTAPETTAEEEEPEPASREPDTAPVWAGLLADARLNIGEIILPGDFNLKQLALQATVNETKAGLDSFEVLVGESLAKAKGSLAFRTDQADKPYRLDADLDFRDFDLGAYLRSVQPDEDPVLEAVLSMTGRAHGDSPNLAVMGDYVLGTFSFSARQGTLRALRRGAVSSGAQVAGVATRLGGLLGDQKEVEAVGQLVTYFNAIRFDRLELDVEREPNFDLSLRNFTLTNQDLRLQGTGKIEHVEGKPIAKQPLRMELRLAASPPLSNLFDSLSLLSEVPDETGFRSLNQPVVIRGNAAEPDPAPLWVIIADAAARAAVRQVAPRQEGGEEPESQPRRLPRIPNF